MVTDSLPERRSTSGKFSGICSPAVNVSFNVIARPHPENSTLTPNVQTPVLFNLFDEASP